MLKIIKGWVRGIVIEELAKLETKKLVDQIKKEVKEPVFTDVGGGQKGEFIQVNKVEQFIKNNDNVSIGDVIESEY